MAQIRPRHVYIGALRIQSLLKVIAEALRKPEVSCITFNHTLQLLASTMLDSHED